MGKTVNKRRAKYAVTLIERRVKTPLEVLDEFIDWTHKKHLKNYIEIGKMLRVSASEANRLLCLATLPDDVTVKRMKELMNGEN
ncbi:hypothetical protein E0E04_05535 [Streptococcus vicugnae]|uniref:Uncharacterized protein n=1 Tax=Streptococcus vicugnae TaxID=2740579 RepID=A0A4R5G5A6_9STRE|nr:hypothetical protein [Streptococcus vicugnae]TDE72503.1 hypothetical protein E0E04_05535 [Streptococcus vicugnae]